jgi:hypothetical protein
MTLPALEAAEETMFASRTGIQLATMGAVAIILSCSPYQVHTDYDEKVSFDTKRTFAWMDSTRPRDERTDNPFLSGA